MPDLQRVSTRALENATTALRTWTIEARGACQYLGERPDRAAARDLAIKIDDIDEVIEALAYELAVRIGKKEVVAGE